MCGCRPSISGSGTCGPYFSRQPPGSAVLYDFKTLNYPLKTANTKTSTYVEIERFDSPCVSSATETPRIRTNVCLPAAYMKSGTQAELVLAPLTINGDGSATIKFYGELDDVNRALGGLSYRYRSTNTGAFTSTKVQILTRFSELQDPPRLQPALPATDLGTVRGVRRCIRHARHPVCHRR